MTVSKNLPQGSHDETCARSSDRGWSGFTLLEMMVSVGIFMLICGSAFTLLGVSQRRYQSESQVLNSFQEARLGLDQMIRDINYSGYPPPNQFEFPPGAPGGPYYSQYADTAVAWSPGYASNPQTTCWVANGCSTPYSWGVVLEVSAIPQTSPSV